MATVCCCFSFTGIQTHSVPVKLLCNVTDQNNDSVKKLGMENLCQKLKYLGAKFLIPITTIISNSKTILKTTTNNVDIDIIPHAIISTNAVFNVM